LVPAGQAAARPVAPVPERPGRHAIRELFAAERRRRALIALGALASVAVAAGIILGAGLSGTSAGASQPTKSAGAATVSRRDLVQTDTEPGTLSYANPHTVFNRLSGTVTSLPAVGQTIRPGQTLYKIDSSPTVLMMGDVPAYRALSASVSDGADVQELKQNLIALGFDPSHQITVNQTFDSATTAAVDRWQASLGQTQNGIVALGQVVFLPGSQRVTAVDTVLGSTGGSGGSGSTGTSASGTTASTTPAPSRPEFVSLTTTTTTTTSSTTTTPSKPAGGKPGKPSAGSQPMSMAALLALLKAETAELQKLRATSGASGGSTGSTGSRSSASGTSKSAGSGASGSTSAASSAGSSGGSSASGAAASAQAILQTTSTNLVVTVALDATKQSEAVLGAPVTVQMPDGSTLDGKITAVSPVAQTSSSSSGSSASGSGGSSSTPSATVPITITLRNSRHVSGLDQAAVSVNFQQQKAKNVLSVPVSALLATAGGGYAVQQASAPHGLIPVTPGLFAAGYVQISGAKIYSGLQVTDSQG
jgi:hypothetical protein